MTEDFQTTEPPKLSDLFASCQEGSHSFFDKKQKKKLWNGTAVP